MTQELAGECRVLFRDRPVTLITTPLPHPVYGTRQARLHRFAFDNPVEKIRYTNCKGLPLGSKSFLAAIESQLKLKPGSGKVGRPR